MPQGQQLPWKRVEYHRVNEGVGQPVGARLGLAGSGYSGAGRKRGHAATAPARYPLLPHPSREVDSGGSVSWYKPKAKSGAVRRESERGIVPRIVETTQLGVGKAAHFGDARAARDGRGHG